MNEKDPKEGVDYITETATFTTEDAEAVLKHRMLDASQGKLTYRYPSGSQIVVSSIQPSGHVVSTEWDAIGWLDNTPAYETIYPQFKTYFNRPLDKDNAITELRGYGYTDDNIRQILDSCYSVEGTTGAVDSGQVLSAILSVIRRDKSVGHLTKTQELKLLLTPEKQPQRRQPNRAERRAHLNKGKR